MEQKTGDEGATFGHQILHSSNYTNEAILRQKTAHSCTNIYFTFIFQIISVGQSRKSGPSNEGFPIGVNLPTHQLEFSVGESSMQQEQ